MKKGPVEQRMYRKQEKSHLGSMITQLFMFYICCILAMEKTGKVHFKITLRDLPHGSVIKNLPPHAGDVSSIPVGEDLTIPHACVLSNIQLFGKRLDGSLVVSSFIHRVAFEEMSGRQVLI